MTLSKSTQEIFQAGLQVLEEGKSAALVTIVRASPRWTVGAKMLVRSDGSMFGDFSDQRLTNCVRDLARAAIAAGQSQHSTLILRDDGFVQARRGESGEVDVFIQVLLSSPTLLLIGAGHIGEAIVRLAKLLKWRVVVVDDRPDFISPTRLPDADERILVEYNSKTESLAAMPITVTPSTFVLVATWGWDEPVLRQIVNTPAAYIGLVASARKSIIIFRDLIQEGIAPETLARVRVPTGLDLGAETPMEIALAIMAEMLMVHRHATGLPLQQYKGSAIMTQSKKGIQS
ncbi:MAG: XdhC family protein [Chloroflexi bacterium]|nr:XdhC family protein [Chloroflexota bacterium]